jgi:hypothetical protein
MMVPRMSNLFFGRWVTVSTPVPLHISMALAVLLLQRSPTPQRTPLIVDESDWSNEGHVLFVRRGWRVDVTSMDDQDEETQQRTRFLMIEAEIPSADDPTLAALLVEVPTMTRLPVVERDWMIAQIETEARRRKS